MKVRNKPSRFCIICGTEIPKSAHGNRKVCYKDECLRAKNSALFKAWKEKHPRYFKRYWKKNKKQIKAVRSTFNERNKGGRWVPKAQREDDGK